MIGTFSLTIVPWLPVALDNGQRVFVRPCDITSTIDDRSILRVSTGRPDCDVSITELLIGLLAVAIGPNSRKAWAERWRKPPQRSDRKSVV